MERAPKVREHLRGSDLSALSTKEGAAVPHSTPATGLHDERVRARFVVKVSVDTEPHPDLGTPCWRWTATRNHKGYGMIRIGRMRQAHRVAYEMWVGLVPDGLELDHACRQRECVSPDHLRPVTHRENTLLGISPSALNAKKTHCPYGHEYTPENTRIYRGYRYCKECGKAQAARRAEKEGRTLGTANDLKTHCPAGHPYDDGNTITNGRRSGRRCRTCHRERQRIRAAKKRLERTDRTEGMSVR